MISKFFSHLTPIGKVPEILIDNEDHLGVFDTISLVGLGQGPCGSVWIRVDREIHEITEIERLEDQKPTESSHHHLIMFRLIGMYLTSETSQHTLHGYPSSPSRISHPSQQLVFNLKSAAMTIYIVPSPT